jgi:L-fuculose-phosphate aldolase
MQAMETGWLHPRDELVETMRRIYRYKMTTTSGGNLSILDPDGSIWITPSRVDKGELQPADIVCVQPDGRMSGLHAPSSEFPFHREIYRRRPDLKAHWWRSASAACCPTPACNCWPMRYAAE